MSFCMKTAEMCFSKHASTLSVAMVTKGGWGGLKITVCFEISSFKLSESFKSVAQGVLEIFEEVYLGEKCAPPPPLWLGYG